MTTRANIVPKDVRHVRICGGVNTYCGHPRQYGLFNFGGGELALAHGHAEWDYRAARPKHGFDPAGYKSRAKTLLQRSRDGGQTWPESESVVVFDETRPVEERRAFVRQVNPKREAIDLSARDSAVIFCITWLGEKTESGRPISTTFALRSADRGRTWEKSPTLIKPPPERHPHDLFGFQTARMPDGSLAVVVSISPPGCVAVYGSDDDGLTWEFLSEVARGSTPEGSAEYGGIVALPDGRALVTFMDFFGQSYSIRATESRDLYAWTPPRPIHRFGASPWRKRLKAGEHSLEGQFPTPVLHRSPWPLLLKDGRIVVLFGRRKPPYGIGGVVSEDSGATWSDEFIVRDDASGSDLGYPVATELDDGRIFTAYYFMQEDGNPHGGARFLAGSSFRV